MQHELHVHGAGYKKYNGSFHENGERCERKKIRHCCGGFSLRDRESPGGGLYVSHAHEQVSQQNSAMKVLSRI